MKIASVFLIVCASLDRLGAVGDVVYGIAACVIGLPRKESGRGGETRGRRPNVMSRYTVVFSGSWRARVMWLHMCARSASCFESLRDEGEDKNVARE